MHMLENPNSRSKYHLGRLSWRLLLVLLGYVLTGYLALAHPYVKPNVSLIWLPSGIALAALVRWGPKMAPAIYLAALLVNLSSGLTIFAAASIAIGNTLAPYFCYLFLKNKRFSSEFARRQDVIWFCLAAVMGMSISASGGALVLWLMGLIAHPDLVWLSWWAGDTVGVLLAGPLLLSVSYSSIRKLAARRAEMLTFILIFVVVHWLIFFSAQNTMHLSFVAMAVMIWAALRFAITWASFTVLTSIYIAGWASYQGQGPFSSADMQANLFLLWLYASTMTVSSLLIAALQAERLAATSELQDSFERINKVASRLPGLILQYRVHADQSSSIPYASSAITAMLEFTQEELKDSTKALFARINPEDREKGEQTLALATQELSIWQSEFRYQRRDSSVRWLYIDGLPEQEAKGSILWHCFLTDITERKQAEQDLRIAATTFESQEGIFVADGNWKVLRVNQAFSRITGFAADELLAIPVQRLHTTHQDQSFFDAIDASLRSQQFWQGELWSKRKNGETYPQMITLTAITDSKGEVSNYIGSFTDISLHKGYEEEIRNLAFYDPLTQLPNRRLLMDRLQHLISVSQRNVSHSALLFLDLDNFKTLNDTRGHDAGDLLLIEAASRLQSCVRDSDTVARLGGDEFVVVLEELSEIRDEAIAQADKVGEKIREMLSQSYQIMDFEHHGSASIGICLFQGADNTVKDLFKRADTAMYEAKTSGRNAVRFFDPAMQAVLVVRMMLESNLRIALALNQFQLYYQVQVNADGQLIGAEALLRWIHPDRGFISPAEFIPLAEETGLIVPIGLWVMDTACAQLKLWEAQADTRHLSLAVNVSAKQFKQADFVDTISHIVHKHQIDASRLKIELTESTILDNVDATTEKMHQLKKLGIAFSMDDFGTGYSSLAYLQRLPLNQLKIDQSFVRDINLDENDATIVRAIIALGINLGLNVIAEGVETAAQRSFLIENHCYSFQGYLFSKPIPAEAFQALIAMHKTLPIVSASQDLVT
ncbi:EAL domain-containing protein [Undibacterium parvum]|uniref:EAL domain-containing protein n=2 Tax=Undibacterium parvum TaxID=401471 RepID=A0A3S9HHZ3_9BURK|nr:EAL domain-containing protein [Undibacterium parvum]